MHCTYSSPIHAKQTETFAVMDAKANVRHCSKVSVHFGKVLHHESVLVRGPYGRKCTILCVILWIPSILEMGDICSSTIGQVDAIKIATTSQYFIFHTITLFKINKTLRVLTSSFTLVFSSCTSGSICPGGWHVPPSSMHSFLIGNNTTSTRRRITS